MSSHSLRPLHPVRAVLALACALTVSGCLGPLEPCDFEGLTGLV